MFKLQRLEITGFKSFADYTELVFTGNGITAIVGPNGCGKSNVADAISWVLGEQRAKSLRGGEMKDVIFQGSKNRLPSGMAEVVLHMVRDETVEEEPDIDDIDATLEELDDQAGAVEERLAPELTAGEAAQSDVQPDAQATPDASASVSAPADVAHATTHESVASTDEATDANAVAVTPESNGDAATVAVVEAEVVESPSLEAEAPKGRGAKARAQHKRHWRPRRLALDFAPGEVVSVTRRLYRDGESEYLLNGRICRLRDIQDLFSGTGLSGAHYAIIEQGRIGQILSAKPMDRRTLIEEAAGITKFRVRQRAAEARLEAARTNLSRVSDIISEIERQVGSLRRQAAKARRYHQLREELRELLRNVYAADEHSLTARLEELREGLAAANEEVERFASELEEREEDARRATAEARGREEELAAERAAVSESALILDRRERERTYQGEQIAALERRLEEIRREAEAVSARIASVIAESESLTLRDVQMREETEATARQLHEAEDAYARRAAEVVEAESAIESARGELLTHTAAAERLSEIGRQLETVLEKLAAQADGLAREGERAAAAHEQAKAEAAKLQEEIGVARTHLNALHSERESRARELAESRAEVAAAAAEHARVRDESARVRHRLDTLAEIDTQHSLYSRAVQRIFSPAETDAPKDFHVVATLADFLRVEPRWERAVEGVFGPHLQSVIVPTPDDALRAAVWLQATGAGRANFLVAGLHGGAESEDSDDAFAPATIEDESVAVGNDVEVVESDVRVASLLGAPRELAEVLNRTLAREMNARVAPSLERAIELTLPGEEMCVTAVGECVIAGQLIAAGGAPVAEDGVGLLAFKREMRELEVRMVGLEADLVFADEAAKSARARLSELEDAFVLLNDEIGRVEREQVAREVSARQLQHEIERTERHMRVVADDAARLAEERREVEERRAKQLAEALAAEESRAAAQRAVSEAADALGEARRAAEAESGKVGEQRAQAATAAERRRAAAAELRRMESESAELQARLERHEREAAEGQERIEALRRSLIELDESASGAESERAALERRVEEASARLAEARERADALTREVAELHQQASSARDARAALEVQRAESAARLNYVRESCMSELNQPLEEVAASFTPEEGFDLEASRARLEELRARVEGFGAVNMMALEELAENEERLQFLTAQRQDIVDGIASTDEALREIKRRSRERFRHAFEEINRNFGQFFLELFGGGRGEMSLIDTEDVLESGIDIVAQPPGKRLQNVLLLSGGEKAMAALSLVLAIFRYRPSPFCLLDEVDAPLDEANVGRFTTKVNEMSAETQFLVITHNKRTMETARALYGVTMEEAGVSRLVSVRFD